MEEPKIQVTVKLELKDYQKFSELFQDRFGVITFFIGIFGVFIIDFIIRSAFGINKYEINFSNNPFPYFLFFGMVFATIWGRISAKKAYKSNSLLQKERIYTFTKDNISIVETDGSGEISYKWSDLHTVRQTKDCFILMVANNIGILIPKKHIESEKIKELEELIIIQLGSKAFPKDRIVRWTKKFFRGFLIFYIIFFSIELITDIISR